ncbi:MAG: hypothetical protein ACRC2B_24070 [Rubrivivax sp.]
MNELARRTLGFIALCGLLLLARTAFGMPGSITFSEHELQTQLSRRFPIQRNLLDMFDLRLSDPQMRLDAQARRLSTELKLLASDSRSGRSLRGRLALGYALRYEPSDGSIRLVKPRVESFDFEAVQGALPRRDEATQRMVIALAERLLDDLVLYRVPAERLAMLRAIGYRPGKLSVTPAGLEITIEPDLPAPASAPAN